jgi:hypothetical protein
VDFCSSVAYVKIMQMTLISVKTYKGGAKTKILMLDKNLNSNCRVTDGRVKMLTDYQLPRIIAIAL